MAQIDLYITFTDSTHETERRKAVAVIPPIGAAIQTARGLRRITDLVYDYADDGHVDVTVHTIRG